MRSLYYILVLILPFTLAAQDTAAEKVLRTLSDQYTSASSIQVDFDLHVQYPEEDLVTLPSRVIQKGDSFVFTNPQYEYYYAGNGVWIYMVEKNELQINDYDPEEEGENFITPLDLLKQWETGAFDYQMSPESTKSQTVIELRPKDEFSDYSKYRLVCDALGTEIQEILAFGKDGSRVTIDIKDIVWDQPVDDSVFSFDKAAHPGLRVEDLRLD